MAPLIGQHRIRIAVARSSELAAKLAQSKPCSRPAGEEMDTIVGVDAASVLMLLSRRQQQGGARTTAAGLGARGRVFECQTCGRRFPTFQALGGHRASHRRPKPYYPYPYGGANPGLRRTRLLDEPRDGEGAPRLHGCPICGLEFAVGQALGGHMRRHRAAAAVSSKCDQLRSGHANDANATSVEETDVGAGCAGAICLELSLAPSENCAKCRNKVVLGNTVHGVRKSLLLDCPPL